GDARRLAVAPFGELGLASDHGGGRRPGRPFALHRDARRALPLEAFTADTDAVAHGAALGHDEIEELRLRIDDDGARLFPGLVAHDLAVVLLRHLADRYAGQGIAHIAAGAVIGGDKAARGAAGERAGEPQ